jgi:hypothetical protein
MPHQAAGHKSVVQARTAVQMPEQTPEGPVPSHLPLPLALVNRPIPLAWRGPATPLILVFPTCLSDASDSLALPSYLRRSEAVRHSPRLTRAGLYPVTRP